jgi:hypothetical protein
MNLPNRLYMLYLQAKIFHLLSLLINEGGGFHCLCINFPPTLSCQYLASYITMNLASQLGLAKTIHKRCTYVFWLGTYHTFIYDSGQPYSQPSLNPPSLGKGIVRPNRAWSNDTPWEALLCLPAYNNECLILTRKKPTYLLPASAAARASRFFWVLICLIKQRTLGGFVWLKSLNILTTDRAVP